MEWSLGPPPQGKLSRYLPVEQRGVGFAMHMKVPVCHFKWENGFLLHLPNNLKLWFWPTGSLKKQDFIKVWLTKDIKQHKNALNASKLTFDANLVGNGTQLFLAVFRAVLSHFQGLSARQIQS